MLEKPQVHVYQTELGTEPTIPVFQASVRTSNVMTGWLEHTSGKSVRILAWKTGIAGSAPSSA